MFSMLRLKHTACGPCRGIKPIKNKCPRFANKLPLKVRLEFVRYKEYGILLHCL